MTNTHREILTARFRAMSARLGQDPLQVQGPGGNTSIKSGDVMWIKASGTELADAETKEIFVAVDRSAALAEAREERGNGSCKETVLDPRISLRPSIETTFHAALEHAVVAHSHSVATIAHAISHEGRTVLQDKLAGLPFAMVPYAKPGLPLTRQILSQVTTETLVIVLQNHGLICCGPTVDAVSDLIEEVETRLKLPVIFPLKTVPSEPIQDGFVWASESWLATNSDAFGRATSGTYYPDHVVFLGPSLPVQDHAGKPPVIIERGVGVRIRDDATASQKAMLKCLSDVLSRIPAEWTLEPIGEEAEVELLNWDAEKYRQALAARP